MSVFFVTGCSTGIGHATALHFARAGHRVYATMRTPGRSGGPLVRAAARLEGEVRLLPLDVTDQDSVDGAVGTALAESGAVDVLVNNAGVGWLGTVEETPVEWLRDTLETNVVGLARVTRAILPSMRERGEGTVVNVSSVAGRVASAVQGHYCASKWAVEGLSESLAQEVHRFGVRVVLVEPGFVRTPILEKAVRVPDGFEEGPYGQLVRRRIEFFRRGQEAAAPPGEVARVIENALRDPDPKLRYLATENAPPAVEGRAAMSDEEWVRLGREMSDEEYAAEMQKRFGSPGSD